MDLDHGDFPSCLGCVIRFRLDEDDLDAALTARSGGFEFQAPAVITSFGASYQEPFHFIPEPIDTTELSWFVRPAGTLDPKRDRDYAVDANAAASTGHEIRVRMIESGQRTSHHAAEHAQALPLGVERFAPEIVESESIARTPDELREAAIRFGTALGFARVGVARAEPLERARARLEIFRARGFAGDMRYLSEGARHDPRALLAQAKSSIVVLFAHGDTELLPLARLSKGPHGRVARYAQGDDYHVLLKTRLLALARKLATVSGRELLCRACVDTAPLLERELALEAGLGFQGKSTLFIAPGVGSYVLLGELLVDLELAPTSGVKSAGCGSCRACLDACPSSAFPEEYVLDARRCISYLTIEHEGPIPHELRDKIGTRVFGCDACQEACPYNASPARPGGSALGARSSLRAPELGALLNLGSAGYRRLVRRSALRRASRTTLQRNAAVALGNSDDPRAVALLAAALGAHASALVRVHAAWALGELAAHLDAAALEALASAASNDADASVRAEAGAALLRIEASRAKTPR